MRLGIKAKQVAGVTLIVGLSVVALSGWYLSSLARVRLQESQVRAEMVANAVFHRIRDLVKPDVDTATALRTDDGLRAILESSSYARSITYAAIVDVSGVAVAHSDSALVGAVVRPAGDLEALLGQGLVAQLRAIYTPGGRTFEIRRPLLMGTSAFGSIRVGVSTLLVRQDVADNVGPTLRTAVLVIVGSSLIAMLLAQVLLRPIHLIRSGLTRLGRGETGVTLDLPQQDEFGDLGASFNAVSARLAADRSRLAGQQSTFESVVEHLEDAVAMVSPAGELLFANHVMRAALPPDRAAGAISALLPAGHPYRTLVEETIATGESRGPLTTAVPQLTGDRLVLTHAIADRDGRLTSVMLVARNVEYLSQMQSTLTYSRKLAALGRLSAGIAHEVKNPLNAMMIHLALLREQLTEPGTIQHVAVIEAEMRRLDEVVQGFLKFTRPEDLKLRPVSLAALLDEALPVIHAEAQARGVDVRVECPADLPPMSADPGMLQQALLNLALNACQAMPNGGRLRIAGSSIRGGLIEIVVEDTGAGIEPAQLDRIFDLYFTTKEHGSGIGLSMVYRTVQLHNGEIEVQSVPGRGTTFRVRLPVA